MKNKRIVIIIITLCISLSYTFYQTVVLQKTEVVNMPTREIPEVYNNINE